ncbi:hypothetical protein VB779_07955 [Haloarculaceae archaeon H-GB11]|nr:hypothetical protein [Haloarculaceae archaeon H-GB11]
MVAENADDDSGSRDVSTRRRRYLALTGVTLGGLTAVTWAASRNRTSAGPADHRAANGQSTGRSGQPADSTTSEQQSPIDSPVPTVSDRVRGAIYLPARAFNGYQIWAFYDPAETRRDLRYATRLRLNALRTFASYEYWRDHPERYRDRFDDFLDAAGDAGVAVLPVLFESIGDAPTEENLTDRNLETSFAVHSPDRRIIRDRSRWGGPRSFVEWFAARYGDRDELLALEIMNEPGMVDRRVAFCRAMLRTARNAHATVPLTMGCRDLSFTRQYSDPALDVLQFHHNLPRTVEDMRAALDAAVRHSNRTDTPVWLSGGSGRASVRPTRCSRTTSRSPGRYATATSTAISSGNSSSNPPTWSAPGRPVDSTACSTKTASPTRLPTPRLSPVRTNTSTASAGAGRRGLPTRTPTAERPILRRSESRVGAVALRWWGL